MRIIHVADTHLGYKNFSGKVDPVRNLNQRECDVYDAEQGTVRRVRLVYDSIPPHLAAASDQGGATSPPPSPITRRFDR